jgi:hypothetical protein
MRFCANERVAQHKKGISCQEDKTSMSKVTGTSHYNFFRVMVMEHAEQTNNCKVAGKYSVSWMFI